jgi:hypothetical protein
MNSHYVGHFIMRLCNRINSRQMLAVKPNMEYF